MKPLVRRIAVAVVATSLSAGAWARDQHWEDRHRYDSGRHHQQHKHYRSSDWVGPVIALGLIGAAVGAAASERERSAPRYYSSPEPAYAPPQAQRDIWYYCASSSQYYPYTAYCPEGWQAIPARPRW